MADIFVSYARVDKVLVEKIVNDLKSSGYDFWMDIQGIEGGKYWPEAISKAILECRILLLFMSPASMASDNVRNEVQIAFEERKVIVILMLEDVEIPPAMRYQLAGRQLIDYKLPDWRIRTVEALDFTSKKDYSKLSRSLENRAAGSGRRTPNLEAIPAVPRDPNYGNEDFHQVKPAPAGLGDVLSRGKTCGVIIFFVLLAIGIISFPSLQAAFVPAPTETNTATLEPSPLPTFTEIPSTLIATPYLCPYQAKTDKETIINLIKAEALAVNTENLAVITLIFAPDAIFRQEDTKPPKIWEGPIARYQDDLFANTDLKEVEHFDILPAVPLLAGETTAYFTSGSRGKYLNKEGVWADYFNGSQISPTPTQYGSDHWTLKKDEKGCWLIVQMDFNAGYVKFP